MFTPIVRRYAAIVCIGIALGLPSCRPNTASEDLHTLNIGNAGDLQRFFKYTAHDIPFISAHRGGAAPGYPENCIETLEYTLQHTPATFEIDPRLTKDSVIVLMHDATLDRTTTGTGKLADYTWQEVKQLKLRDADGNITGFRVPTLEETIEWARGKTVLILDKKDVPLRMTADLIRKLNAEAHVMATVHNAEEARFYHDDNNDIVFEAFVKTTEALQEYEQAGIPWTHVMAYVGPRYEEANKPLYDMLHQRGVMCMVSAAPVYDKLDEPARKQAYEDLIRSGIDIIESDRPVEAARAIKPLLPAQSHKQVYFNAPE